MLSPQRSGIQCKRAAIPSKIRKKLKGANVMPTRTASAIWEGTLKASDARRSRHRSEELRRGGRDSCKKKGALRQAKTGDPMVFEKPV